MSRTDEYFKLSEVTEIITDGSHNPPKGVEESEYLMLSSRNVFNDDINLEKVRYLSEKDYVQEDKRTALKDLDVLLTIVGTIGRAAVFNSNLGMITLQRSVAVIRPTQSKLNSRFLMYSLQSMLSTLLSESRGVAQQGFYLDQLRNLNLFVPCLEKQSKIVSKLDSAFAEIDLLEGNLGLGASKTNQLLQSLLSSAFSSTADESELSNKLGEITNATNLVLLGDVCAVINGGTPDTKNSTFWDGKHAWITPAEMGNLKSPYLAGSKRTLTDEGLSNSSAQLVPKHSVIMSSRAPIGHLVINEVPMASNQGCKGMIPNGNLNYKYLYYFLYANKRYLNELGSGTTFTEISGSKLKTVLIPLPSLLKQSEVVEKLDKAFAEIDLIKEQIRKQKDYATALRQSLLSSAFAQEEEVA